MRTRGTAREALDSLAQLHDVHEDAVSEFERLKEELWTRAVEYLASENPQAHKWFCAQAIDLIEQAQRKGF